MTTTIESDKKKVEIDFLYLDLEVCTRCKGTDANLAIALESVANVLEASGVEVVVRKTLVDSEQRALELGFITSPTIRVNGHDIALELRESSCASCSEACGCDGKVDCRVWVYRGEEHNIAPVPMIVDAILSAVYSVHEEVAKPVPTDDKSIPESLKRFLDGKAAKQQSCCSPAQRAKPDYGANVGFPLVRKIVSPSYRRHLTCNQPSEACMQHLNRIANAVIIILLCVADTILPKAVAQKPHAGTLERGTSPIGEGKCVEARNGVVTSTSALSSEAGMDRCCG